MDRPLLSAFFEIDECHFHDLLGEFAKNLNDIRGPDGFIRRRGTWISLQENVDETTLAGLVLPPPECTQLPAPAVRRSVDGAERIR